jgi:uncharacterized protein (TIGR02453 family)
LATRPALQPIPVSVFQFLRSLKKNNDREWFLAHKEAYAAAHEHMIAFADGLLLQMNQHDLIETPSGKKSLHRIYRDVRFSKEKTPYKTNWSGSFRRATKRLRGGYYFHIEPGNSFVAGGFFNPNAEDLLRIRQDIDLAAGEFRKALKKCSKSFPELRGEQLKTAPAGFSKEHEAIDLLRYKQFVLKHTFSDEEVLDSRFPKQINQTFKELRPFFNHMSEILCTDVNGTPLF